MTAEQREMRVALLRGVALISAMLAAAGIWWAREFVDGDAGLELLACVMLGAPPLLLSAWAVWLSRLIAAGAPSD